MRLRVLHVTPYSDLAWGYGGIPRVVGALSRGLARRGHDVTVCATDAHDATTRLPGHAGPWFRARPPMAAPDGVVLRIFPNLSNRVAYALQAFLPLGLDDYLRTHAADFDVAHLHGCHHLLGTLAAYHLRRAGVPYVVAPNGTAPVFERRRTAKRVFDALFGRTLLPGAARVLAVSDAERCQLADLGVPAAAIHTVPNPLDLSEFSGPLPHGQARRRWGVGEAPVVLFLGKITPRKNVETLVRAFARLTLPNARLVIAGNDMGGGRQARRAVEQLGLQSRTLFPGLLTGADRLQALGDADLVVYASEHEVFGLVPFEAMLAGTPVVVAGDSGCGALVRASGGGLVVAVNDVSALTSAIAEILTSPGAWRLAASRAGAHIRASYGADPVSARIESMYLAMVGPRQHAISA